MCVVSELSAFMQVLGYFKFRVTPVGRVMFHVKQDVVYNAPHSAITYTQPIVFKVNSCLAYRITVRLPQRLYFFCFCLVRVIWL